MTRSSLAVVLGLALVAGVPRSAAAQDTSALSGRWAINRTLSQFPPEIGFNVDWAVTRGSGPGSAPGGGGGRSGSGGAAGPMRTRPESEDDAKRVQLLTAEVRNPPGSLTVVETAGAVTFTDERGLSRTFHPDGKAETIQVGGVPVGVTAKREAGRLVVLYDVEQGRQLRSTYARTATPPQLVVDVQFIERGGGGEVRRVYEPATAADTAAPAAATASRPAATPGATAADANPLRSAASGGVQGEKFNQQPDAELKGIRKLGVVVEELSSQAAACGLSQSALETAVSKRLTDAGFTVLRNSDQDTYVYVNIITTTASTGLCVSRYDAFLYTYTTAKLSYQETPVLVQVSLLHKGGIAGGSAAAHAEGVLRGVQEYVGQFSMRIHDANK